MCFSSHTLCNVGGESGAGVHACSRPWVHFHLFFSCACSERQSFSIFKAGNTDSGWHVSLAFLPLLYLINRSNLIPRVELNFNDVQLDFQLVSSPEDMTGGGGYCSRGYHVNPLCLFLSPLTFSASTICSNSR